MDNHLNAQQIQQIQKAAADQVEAYITRLQLRKWSVEQALTRVKLDEDLIIMAGSIYDFVVQPLKLDLTP